MSRLVEAARQWLGVPFRHRGRSRMGVDCAGLVWVAYRDCGLELPDFRLYGREPHADGLEQHVARALGEAVQRRPVRSQALQPGDVLVVRFAVNPHHVALVADRPGGLNVIHADGHTGRVIEHRLAEKMIQRITHVHRRPV